jgi:hypothetical protein
MGGVIQIMPSSAPTHFGADPRYGGNAFFRYASADRGRTLHTHASSSVAGLSALAGLTGSMFSDLSGGRHVGVQPYSGYNHWSANAHLDYTFSDGLLSGWKVSAVYLMSRIEGAGRTEGWGGVERKRAGVARLSASCGRPS